MIDVIAHEGNRLIIGRQGENQAVRIVFDVSSWLSLTSEGEYTSFTLVAKRPGDGEETYPCITTYENGKVYWVVSNADVANAGHGTCELVMTVGEAIAKSTIYSTLIHKSLAESEDPPEEYQAWVDTVIAAGATATGKAAAAAASATEAASSAEEASDNADAAKTAAGDASIYATAAINSAAAAAAAEKAAVSSASSASESATAAASSATAAAASASSAASSAEAAAASAKTAADDAVAAVETEIKGYVESAGKSATAAETAAASVSASAAQIEANRQDLSRIQDMTSEEEQAGNYAGYHLGFYLDTNGDLCQKE